jgi:hypothetical protein
MYGRSAPIGTADLSFLEGATLIQVALGAFDLGLHFDGPPAGIMISSSFATKLGSATLQRHEIVMGHLLRPFLNRDVVRAVWAEMGTLILTFDGDDQIHIFDDSDQYESYIITHRQTTIVI